MIHIGDIILLTLTTVMAITDIIMDITEIITIMVIQTIITIVMTITQTIIPTDQENLPSEVVQTVRVQ